MDGLLVVDKPVGPTSHDVVARVRRLLRERRVGHTGTLDPMASGVLPLMIGRATRLARFYSASGKQYEATVRLGVATDTYDAQGRPTGPVFTGRWPDAGQIERALEPFRGRFLQQPPAYSAKKIDGQRSYKLARAHRHEAHPQDGRGQEEGECETTPAAAPLTISPLPAPAMVSTSRLRLGAVDGADVTLDVACSAGFYVRSLAHDLGAALGTGAHLAALRRTVSAGIGLASAVPLAEMEAGGAARALAALIPMDRLLPALAAAVLTPEGYERVRQGRDVARQHTSDGWPDLDPAVADLASVDPGAADLRSAVRLCAANGELVAIARPGPAPGLLHPAIVLV